MNCDTLQSMMSRFSRCELTEAGTKFDTHCVYPSFEVVAVYVSRWGDGFKVSDGGGAVRCAFAHGRDENSMKDAIKEATRQYDLSNRGRVLEVEVSSMDWLYSAIIAVANGSALAATKAVESQIQKKEQSLSDKIFESVVTVIPKNRMAKDYQFRGKSGKNWHVDVAVLGDVPLLIKGVTPHHVSVNSTYVTFSDISEANQTKRFAVYEKSLENEDTLLLGRFADIVPLRSVSAGAERAVSVTH